LATIDEDYILVEMKYIFVFFNSFLLFIIIYRDELTVMNASNQSLVAWLSTRNSFLIGYNHNFVVILKSNQIILYHIKLQVNLYQPTSQ
jgi:hypothetical protein